MASAIRCHYEVLNVERDASLDDLKKSYRKLALKYHPDKNPDNIDEATSQFRLVQQAYEVLSDPQERAWYDKHREAILRGLGKGEKYEDDSLDLFQYFNSSCYNGFGDDDEGFYAVYRAVFETISEEDYVFMPDREEDEEFPAFGDSTSDYDEVVGPFYAFWTSFLTNKSYVWVEEHDTRDAPDRRVRRAMEMDNKKLRDAAKKERNEEIRNLAAYVRKRDKRVQAYKKKLEERNAEIERKAKEKRAQEILEQQKRLSEYQEAGWSAMNESDLDALEARLDEHLGHAEEYVIDADNMEGAEEFDESVYMDELYCVACNKAFKSEKAFTNHEKSKKHKEMVEILAEEMRLEEEGGENEEVVGGGGEERLEELEREVSVDDLEETEERLSDADIDNTAEKAVESQGGEIIDDSLEALLSEEDEDFLDELQQRSNKKKKKKRKQKNVHDTEEDIITENLAEVKLTEETVTKKSAKSKKARRKAAKSALDEEEVVPENETIIITNEISEEISNASLLTNGEAPQDDEGESFEKGDGESEKAPEEIEDTVASSEANEQQDKTKNKRQKKPKNTEKCNVCQGGFPSRNQLFEHIKQTGHAMRADVAAEREAQHALDREGERGGKKGKKKGRR